jgi:hypothetical protein
VVLDELHHEYRWVDAVQAMELVCNVYGVDYLPCPRYSSKIKGYAHAVHGLAPSAGTGMRLITRTPRYMIHSSGSQVAPIAA